MAEDSNIYVPDEIVDNILVRLPTKSLTRFRCVSKHWNRLISDPDFMKSLSRRKIFVLGVGGCCHQTIETFVSGENRMGYRIVRTDIFQVERVNVVGTANGLVLLVPSFLLYRHSKVNMMLYNPLTRVFKKVPYPPYIPEYHSVRAFGLGHGATTQDDLKIVTLLGPKRSNKTSSSLLSWGVFSVRNQSWSTIMSESSIGFYGFPSHAAGTFLNGFLYWKVRKDDFSPGMSILALDIKKMKLLAIEVPYECTVDYTMGTINGCLCLLYGRDYFHYGYQLMVMKDHGIWESHVKERPTTTRSRNMRYEEFRVMCILDEGKFILKNSTRNAYFIVDLLKNSSEPILDFTDYDHEFTTQAVEYVESFCNI